MPTSIRPSPRSWPHQRARAAAFLLLSAALLLPACSRLFAPDPKADDLARRFTAMALDNDFQAARPLMDPEYLKDVTPDQFAGASERFKREKPVAVRRIGYMKKTELGRPEDQTRIFHYLTYQLQFPDLWGVVYVMVFESSGRTTIAGFRYWLIPDSLDRLNAFTLSGKGLVHYLMLFLVAAEPVFIIYCFYLLVRARHIKRLRKWLWGPFILFGVGALYFNWTTGATAVSVLTIKLLGAAFVRSGDYAPWILSVSFPLGAIIFLLDRRVTAVKLSMVMQNPESPEKSDQEKTTPPPAPPPAGREAPPQQP